MLIYKLDLKGAFLVVRLEEPNVRRVPYIDSLKEPSKANELLIKIHLRANAGRSVDTLSFQEITLPSNCTEVIRALIQTGNLFFRGQKVKEALKTKLYWTEEAHSNRSATFQAYFSSTDRERSLDSVDLLWPSWILVETQWMELDTTVPWKWIELFRKGPCLFEGVQKRNFLEEEPPILYRETVATFEKQPEQPLPCLRFTDSTGCFANLFMHYPSKGEVLFDSLSIKREEIAFEEDLIEAGYARKTVGKSHYYCPSERVRQTIQFLLEIGWTCLDSMGRKIYLQTGIEVHISENHDRLQVRGAVSFQDRSGTLKAAQTGKLFQELDKDSVGLLDAKKIPLIEGVWNEEGVQIPKRRLGDILPLLNSPFVQWEEALHQAASRFATGMQLDPVSLDSFNGTLLPYQEKGVEWLSFLKKWGFSALLSDEMGLGKTVQVLAFFSSLRTNLPILIIAPTSLLFNWQREISKFWQGAQVYIHTGSDRLKHLQDKSIVLTSYALLRIDEELFSSTEFEAIALDESQMIKSATSQVARAAFRLKGRFKIAMTGTPVENRMEELWSQFHFLMPDLLGEKVDFQRFETESIRRKIKPFMLRRQKKDVQIDLPEKIERAIWVTQTAEQQTLYEQTISGFKSGLLKKVQADGIQAHRMEVLEVILRLRQICADPRLAGGEAAGGKSDLVKLVAEELVEEGKKALIFSQFTTFLRLLEKDLKEVGIETLYLDGSTPAHERGELVRTFQEGEKPYLFLLSLKAGGVGLNLTAAETVILLDPWWNEAVERQAIDRAHRIGQKNSLLVSRYLTPDSIEEKMLEIKARKMAIADQLLLSEADASWAPNDLLELLK